jgi:hypothetical protein
MDSIEQSVSQELEIVQLDKKFIPFYVAEMFISVLTGSRPEQAESVPF